MTTAKEQLAHWDQILDDYEKSIGLVSPQDINTSDIESYLSMPRNQLEKLSGEDCAQIAYILISYSYHLQKAQNRELARINWATTTLRQAIAHAVGEYNKYATYAERTELAIQDNSYANKLHAIKAYAQSRYDRLNYLSTNVKNLADILLHLQKAKSGGYNNVA